MYDAIQAVLGKYQEAEITLSSGKTFITHNAPIDKDQVILFEVEVDNKISEVFTNIDNVVSVTGYKPKPNSDVD